jgi:DNA-binding transcriptional ArsR family regulator
MTTNALTDPQIEGPDDEFLIEDLDIVRMLNDPVRSTILQLLIFEPKSVKDLAAELDVPVTRLYYHVNMLEDSGVIRVVATRKAGAMIQKLYQATARSYRPSPRIVDTIDDPREAARIGVATVLDTARVDVEQAVAARFAEPDGDHPPSGLGRTILRLSPAEAQRLLDELGALLESFEDISDDTGMWMSFSYAFAPSAGLPKGAVDGD